MGLFRKKKPKTDLPEQEVELQSVAANNAPIDDSDFKKIELLIKDYENHLHRALDKAIDSLPEKEKILAALKSKWGNSERENSDRKNFLEAIKQIDGSTVNNSFKEITSEMIENAFKDNLNNPIVIPTDMHLLIKKLRTVAELQKHLKGNENITQVHTIILMNRSLLKQHRDNKLINFFHKHQWEKAERVCRFFQKVIPTTGKRFSKKLITTLDNLKPSSK